MRRSLFLPTVVLLSACASGGGGHRTFDNPLGRPQDMSYQDRTLAPVHHSELPAGVDELAGEVPGIYQYLGLQAEAGGGDATTFYTPSMRISGQLYDGHKNSEYIDCGDSMQGPRADVFDVEFAVATRLRAKQDGGTVVETRLEGWARDRFVNERSVYCVGTGTLEGEIAELLRRGGVG